MPNYRRAFAPGGSFFFTLVANRRARLFGELLAIARQFDDFPIPAGYTWFPPRREYRWESGKCR
jgi:hypothetical protein